jgi:hypothetical protein
MLTGPDDQRQVEAAERHRLRRAGTDEDTWTRADPPRTRRDNRVSRETDRAISSATRSAARTRRRRGSQRNIRNRNGGSDAIVQSDESSPARATTSPYATPSVRRNPTTAVIGASPIVPSRSPSECSQFS